MISKKWFFDYCMVFMALLYATLVIVLALQPTVITLAFVLHAVASILWLAYALLYFVKFRPILVRYEISNEDKD